MLLNEKKEKQDISELLREADAENEVARARQERIVPEDKLVKTIVAPAVRPEGEKADRGLDAETKELIDQYSTREVRDEKSDTQELRDTLARKLQGNKLLGYLEKGQSPGAPKMDNLRTLIRNADQMSAEEMERHASGTDPSGRFSEESDLPMQESFEQSEMFPTGEKLPENEKKKTFSDGFDRDYEKLGQKVIERGVPESSEDASQLSFLPEETDVEPVPSEMDEKEINLRLAFDMMQEGEYDGETVKVKPARKKKTQQEQPLIRYTARSQNAEIFGKLKKERLKALLRLVISCVLLFVLWRFEASGANGMFGFLLRKGSDGIRLYLLLDLQLLLLCGLAVLPLLVRGVRAFFARKLIPESLLVFGLLVETVYTVSQLVLLPQADAIHLYGLTAGLCAVCAALADVLNVSRDCHSFRVVSSKRPKYIAQRLENAVKESEEFSRHLYEDSELYTVQRTDFVEGFAERTVKRAKYNDVLHLLLPLLLLASACLFAGMLLTGHTGSEAFRDAMILLLFSLPCACFFMIPLPVFAATLRARKCSGAFIGNGIAEEYAQAAAISFADTEVYPSNLVNITSVKTYGSYRIDKVISDVARIFSFLGGPLAKVTERMIDGEVEKPRSARVIENVSDGICVAIDGRHIFLGKRSYLRRYRFDAPVDEGDASYEKGVGSVMYVVIDEQLAAKFYIRYRINPRFEQLLHDLYRAGLCLGIKTMDPNITADMIMGNIKFRKCPIAVLKQDAPVEVCGESERAPGGVVCNSSLHNFLKMFSLCDKVRHVTRCNAIVATVSVVLSAGVVAFLALTGTLQDFSVTKAVLFQLCWQLPLWLLSLFAI